jgi:hypothetical protein
MKLIYYKHEYIHKSLLYDITFHHAVRATNGCLDLIVHLASRFYVYDT